MRDLSESKTAPKGATKPVVDMPENVRLAEIKRKSDIMVAFINHLPFLAIALVVALIFLSLRDEIKRSLPKVEAVEYAGVKVQLSRAQMEAPKLPSGFGAELPAWKAAARRALDKAGALQNKKILWVDDNRQNNREIVNFLTAFRVQVTPVTSNKEAFSLLKNSDDFDIIITDIGRDNESNPELPKEDPINDVHDVGLDLISRARALGFSDRIIVYSAGFTPEVEDHSREWPQGAYGVTNQADELLNQIIDLSQTTPAR